MEQHLYELLRQCTVRISSLEKKGHGTGFFVAPGLILTCAHVLLNAQPGLSKVEVSWRGRPHLAQITKLQQAQDLALLQVNLTEHPCVYLHEGTIPFDALYSYGYSDHHPDGDPATFTLEGKAGGQEEQLKFKSGQVRPGLSGAPLLNVRTGYVCGVVQLTRDRNNDLGGRAIPTTTVFRVFPEIVAQQQQFHRLDKRWTICLDDTTGTRQLADRPRNYIPFPRNPLFQPRPGEFKQLEHRLVGAGKKLRPIRIGLVGMGGIGKTQLAVEVAYRCLDRQRFLAGIFWMVATENNFFDWQFQLAELAFKTGYLPPDDDTSSSENERRRAMHLCRYLADHRDALLILDNVEDPSLVLSVLPTLAGGDVACSILYTSRNKFKPEGVITHPVEQLQEETALHLLLSGNRPSLLSRVVAGSSDEEADAAREICREVGYLPLALVHLRGWLIQDPQVTLMRLKEVLTQRGALELAKQQYGDAASLFVTFRLSWEKIDSEEARRVLKLASYFPEAAPIPLWLLGLAAGLGEQGDIFEPLGQARVQLLELSLLEVLSEGQVRLHPLVRAFVRHLIAEEGDKGKTLLTEAGERLATPFINLNELEQRILQKGYWECLSQVRAVRASAVLLGTAEVRFIERVEYWLDRESNLLAGEKWWPSVIPGLFYQQIFNRAVEEGSFLFEGRAPDFWLRQLNQAGAEDQSQIRVYAGHTGPVTAVAFSPDGRKILTGSNDQTARLWDTASGQVLLILEGHTAEVNSVAFSPDGKHLLTGASDGIAIVWDAENGQVLRRLEGHTSVVEISWTTDGAILVVDAASHRILATLEGHTAKEVLLESPSDGIILLRNRADGQVLVELPKPNSWVTSVAFSPDGTKVLTGSSDRTARLWERTSGQTLLVLQGHYDTVTSVKFSPDEKKILTGSNDQTARVWDTASGQTLMRLDGHTSAVTSVAFSPDGTKALTGSSDETTRLWDAVSGQLLLTLKGYSNWYDSIDSVAFSPDGKRMLTGSYDGTAKLWDLVGEQILMIFTGHASSYVRSVAFSPDGRYGLTGADDQTARLWDTACGQKYILPEEEFCAIECLAFSPDGRRILTGSWDGIGRVLDAATGQVLTVLEGHTSFIMGVAFSPDGRQVLTSSQDGTARIWDAIDGQSLVILERAGGEGMVFSPDGTKVLMEGAEHNAHVWDTANAQVLTTFEGHTGAVVSVAFSPDGKRALTGSADGTARIWDPTNGHLQMQLQGHTAQVNSVSFSPDGKLVLTSSTDGTARIWDTTSGRMLTILDGHPGSVGRAAFSPDGRWILTRSYERVHFWQIFEVNKVRLLGLYVAPYGIAAFHWNDSNSVILADTGGPHCHPHFYHLKLEGTW